MECVCQIGILGVPAATGDFAKAPLRQGWVLQDSRGSTDGFAY